MTNNPLRKARKKVKEKKAKYEVNPSPELKQDIEKWEEKLEELPSQISLFLFAPRAFQTVNFISTNIAICRKPYHIIFWCL